MIGGRMSAADPANVDALLMALCGRVLADPDPRTRYHALTDEQAVYTTLVAAIRRHRGQALDEWAQALGSRQAAANELKVSRQRVGQIIDAGQNTTP